MSELEVESYLMKTGKVIYDYPYFVDENYSDLTIIYPKPCGKGTRKPCPDQA